MVETSPGSMSRLGRVERWMPGVRVLRTYDRAWLPRDLIAGVVLVTLLVPQGMAYAELSGLPPITGLYTTVVCLVAYAFVGPSPVLVLGPDSSLGPMIAATILPLAAGDEQQAIALAGMLALMVGLVTVGAGVATARLRRGPALEPGPDRVPGGTRGRDLRRPAAEAVRVLDRRRAGSSPRSGRSSRVSTRRTRGRSASACSASASSWVSRRVAPRTPGILVAVVVAIALSIVLDLAAARRVRDRRAAAGLPGADPSRARRSPTSRSCSPPRSGSRSSRSATRSRPQAASRTRGGYEVDGNQELAGIGSANLAAGLFSGFPVSTSGSRTAVAAQSGAKTQLTGLVAAGLVLADAARRAGPRPGDAPAGPGGGRHRGVDQPVRRRRAAPALPRPQDRVRPRRGLRPRRRVRRRPPGHHHRGRPVGACTSSSGPGRRTRRCSASRRGSPATTTSGAIPMPSRCRGCSSFAGRRRSSSPTPTSSATGSASWSRRPSRRRTGSSIAAEPITDIDTTAGAMLADLDLELNASGIHLAFAELQSAVRDMIVRYGLLETHRRGPYLPVGRSEAVEAYRRELGS